MKIKVDIITGFLGSGKTTLIKKLIEERLYSDNVVIIENEFGEISIDGILLKKANVEVKEINSGCICCTLIGDFMSALGEIITKFNPDRIIIEPSGVGKLSDVVKSCESLVKEGRIEVNMLIAVVDVLKYEMHLNNFGEFYKNQIINAKTIILSRTQKAGTEKIESVVNSIKKVNRKANIITTPWTSISTEKIIFVAENEADIALQHELIANVQNKFRGNIHNHSHECKDHNCKCHSHNHNHSADEVFDAWGVETPKNFDEAEIRYILEKLDDEKTYGHILRGKGIIQTKKENWVEFEYVPEEYEIKEISADYTSRICIIGKGLNKGELAKLFNI